MPSRPTALRWRRPPLRRATGAPTCTGDLQFGAVFCAGLVAGAKYSVTRARGSDTLSGHAAHDGTLVVGPFRGAPPLTGGDVLTLSNGHRVLTRLHLAHLRAVIDGEQTVLGPGSSASPASTTEHHLRRLRRPARPRG